MNADAYQEQAARTLIADADVPAFAEDDLAVAWEPRHGAQIADYARAWLAYQFVGQALGQAPPLPAAWGLDKDAATEIAEGVESLVIEMRDPRFDQDDWSTL